MRIRLLFSEALRSIGANASTTVAATMTVLIGMFLLGLSVALGTWMLSWSNYAEKKLLVKVYFCTPLTCGSEATPAQINAVRARLDAMSEVERVVFVSKDEAFQIMERRTPELVRGVSSNPLPHSFEVTPRKADEVHAISAAVRDASLPGVQKVRDGEKVADRILKAAAIVSAVVGIAVIVLVIASTLLIANTIRLSIFSRRREIEVMKLVGATNWFVRGPFMIEGLICGVIGSAIAVVLLLFGKMALTRLDIEEYGSGVQAIGFAWNAAILILVGLLLGAAGSGLTLRRFLRV
jgi:cell division transport system permease protein